MGIQLNVSAKNDYSTLFSSLPSRSGSSSSAANLNFLSDYVSIKNGSYGKLMKAYYGKADTSALSENNSASISTAKDSNKALAKVESAAEGLKESADKLISKGTDSLFKEKDITVTDENGVSSTKKGYDTDAIYKAVSSFVDNYNSVLNAAGDTVSTSINNRTATLINMTKSNEKLLASAGITIGKDNKLSIDEDTFKKADMTTVKSLFNGTGSYAYKTSAQASLIDYAANNEASKSNTYGVNGTYNNNYTSGSIYAGYL